MGRVVLCAVDEGTLPAACEVGSHLAGRLDLPLVLAHVVENSTPRRFDFLTEKRERGRHHAHRRGQEALQRCADSLTGAAQPVTHVVNGSPFPTLLDLARDEDAELIVVGSRGRGAVAAALFGSFSRAAAREAPCPVVVVPPGAVGGDGRIARLPEGTSSLVCGVPATERSGRSVRFAADLARRLGDRLVVVLEGDASTDPAVLGELDHGVQTVVSEGSLGPTLEAVAQAEEARLIAIGGRVGGFARALLDGSPETGLVRHARSPLVVLPEPARVDAGSGHYELDSAA